SYQCRPFQQL
ncbi:hypothetical protein MIMGU_mgv1a0261621mg, partial [Erythranthe guttata]